MKKVFVELNEKEADQIHIALDERVERLDSRAIDKKEGEHKEAIIGNLRDTQDAQKKISDAINKAKP